jgi:hypothetical protein
MNNFNVIDFVAEYISTIFESYRKIIFVDSMPPIQFQEFILLTENQGSFAATNQKSEIELLIISQSREPRKAKTIANNIFRNLNLITDLEIIKGKDKANIPAIYSLETPTLVGNVGNGLYQYSQIFKIILGSENETFTKIL